MWVAITPLALPFCCHTRLPKWRLESRNEKGKLHSSQAYLSATLQAAILHFCTTTHNPPSPFSWLHGWLHWLHPCNMLCRFSQVTGELEFLQQQQKQQRGIKEMLRRRIAYIWMWARWIRFRKDNASHRLYPGVCLVVCFLPLVMNCSGLWGFKVGGDSWNAPLRPCPLGQWERPHVDEIIDRKSDSEKCSTELPTLKSRSPTWGLQLWILIFGRNAAGLMAAFGILAVRALD